MPISLNIQQIDGNISNQQIPITSESVFDTYWLPVCESHQLGILINSSSGISLNEKHIPSLIEELEMFKKVLSSKNLPDPILEHIYSRLASLKNELDMLTGHQVEFFIG